MATKAEKLDYIASVVKELVGMSDELGRRTLSFLLRMAILEAEGGAFDPLRPGADDRDLIASLVKELAEMSESLGSPTLSYLLHMATLEASGEAPEGPRPVRSI
jgi:hypothetical protein